MANRSKPLVWKKFIDDNFSLCDFSVKEVYIFFYFARLLTQLHIKLRSNFISAVVI